VVGVNLDDPGTSSWVQIRLRSGLKCILSMSSTLTFDSFPALRIAHRDCFARVECLSQTDMHIGICAVLENSFPLHSNPRAYDDESHIRVVDFAVSVTI
jgi:hypothetical protein